MAAPAGRGRAGKILQKASNQTRVYYEGWKNAEEQFEKKDDLYGRAINSLVYNVKKRKVAENKPPKIQEVIKEVIKEVEVIKKVPVERIKLVPFEVEVPVDNPETIKKLTDEFSDRLNLEKLSRKAMEKRFQTALTQSRLKWSGRVGVDSKKYKRLAMYAFISTPLVLTQILTWIIL